MSASSSAATMDQARRRVLRTPGSQDRVQAPVQLPRAFSCARELLRVQFAEILQTDHRQLHPHDQVIMDEASAVCSRKLRATLSSGDSEFNNAALWKITPIERRTFVSSAREHRVMSVSLIKDAARLRTLKAKDLSQQRARSSKYTSYL